MSTVSEGRYDYDMFELASNFNEPLNAWDVNRVTDMSSMFYAAESFNQELNAWDVSRVTICRVCLIMHPILIKS